MDLTHKIEHTRLAKAKVDAQTEMTEVILGPLFPMVNAQQKELRQAEINLACGILLSEVTRFLELKALNAIAAEVPGSGETAAQVRKLCAEITREFAGYKAPEDLLQRAGSL